MRWLAFGSGDGMLDKVGVVVVVGVDTGIPIYVVTNVGDVCDWVLGDGDGDDDATVVFCDRGQQMMGRWPL